MKGKKYLFRKKAQYSVKLEVGEQDKILLKIKGIN
jgi:hypothetical protein